MKTQTFYPNRDERGNSNACDLPELQKLAVDMWRRAFDRQANWMRLLGEAQQRRWALWSSGKPLPELLAEHQHLYEQEVKSWTGELQKEFQTLQADTDNFVQQLAQCSSTPWFPQQWLPWTNAFRAEASPAPSTQEGVKNPNIRSATP